jgi:hypothetical protein
LALVVQYFNTKLKFSDERYALFMRNLGLSDISKSTV